MFRNLRGAFLIAACIAREGIDANPTLSENLYVSFIKFLAFDLWYQIISLNTYSELKEKKLQRCFYFKMFKGASGSKCSSLKPSLLWRLICFHQKPFFSFLDTYVDNTYGHTHSHAHTHANTQTHTHTHGTHYNIAANPRSMCI